VALLIFGSGASRGASFVRPTTLCRPPLDRDFFTQLQRIQNPKLQPIVDKAIANTVDLFGNNFTVTMETVFTTIEQSLRLVEATRERRNFRSDDLRKQRTALLQALAAVFEESLIAELDGVKQPRACEYHEKVVRRLARRDALISFNYDCLLDQTLKDHGAKLWNPRYGYGFRLGSRGVSLEGDDAWQPKGEAVSKEATIHLLKLHGSMHFKIQSPEGLRYSVILKQRPYTRQNGDLQFTIIPPEWNKPLERGAFADLWKRAGDAIYRARTLVFIGYSFPPGDPHAASLFRVNCRTEHLDNLVIVNPDQEARRRTREVLIRALKRETRVLVFDNLAEFARAPRTLWDRAG
jgi:hypothetical protein